VEDFRAAGAELVVVGSGTPEQARWFAEDQPGTFRVLTDPELTTFRAIGAARGLGASLGFGVLKSALRAWRKGFRQSATEGDPLQQGAVWVVRPGGEVLFSYRSRYAGDHPDPALVLAVLA
jgi:peroxiredoxin